MGEYDHRDGGAAIENQLEIAIAEAHEWLKHHYEIVQLREYGSFAVVFSKHLGNTPGTAKIKGEPNYVLIETDKSLNDGYPERHRTLAAKVGKFSLMVPRGQEHDPAIHANYVAVKHVYSMPAKPSQL